MDFDTQFVESVTRYDLPGLSVVGCNRKLNTVKSAPVRTVAELQAVHGREVSKHCQTSSLRSSVEPVSSTSPSLIAFLRKEEER